MDKKNTMLLTVIAVATLLVAVVGATFAYFAVEAQNNSETVKVTGSATAVGIAKLTTTNSAMHINLTGTDMAYDARNAVYYATTGTEDYATGESPNTIEIAKISVEGGDTSLTYTCDYSFTISKGTDDTMIAKMVAGDGKIVIAGDGLTTTDTDFDLTELAAGNLTFAGSISDLSTVKSGALTAYVQVNNTTGEQKFANTSLAIEINADQDSFACRIND